MDEIKALGRETARCPHKTAGYLRTRGRLGRNPEPNKATSDGNGSIRTATGNATSRSSAPDGSSQTILGVTAPPEKRGYPMQIPRQSEWDGLQKEPVKILTSSEPWNKYRIPQTSDIFQIKLVVSEVFRVKDDFDNFGEPFYILTSGPLVSPASIGSVTIGTD